MLPSMPGVVGVVLDKTASRREVRAIKRVLHSAGLDAPVVAEWKKQPQTGNGAFWMIIVTLGMPLSAFFTAIATEAGKDFYRFAQELRAARGASRIASDG
jgi:hypothetical protein